MGEDLEARRTPEPEPEVGRPRMPEGYGIPASDEGLLPWTWAVERLERAPLYWVATTRPDGRPHVMPIWGAWLDGTFYFEGGPDTRRGRNIAANPAVVVHVEQGDDVVIVEGFAQEVRAPDRVLAERLIDAFGSKYEPKYGYRPAPDAWSEGGLYAVRPDTAFAWSEFPRTTTRYRFRGA